MKAMLKFPLQTGANTLRIPGGLKYNCHVAHQPGQPAPLQLWQLVDTAEQAVAEDVYVCVTGEELPDGFHYNSLGTVLMAGGGFVVHALHAQKKNTAPVTEQRRAIEE